MNTKQIDFRTKWSYCACATGRDTAYTIKYDEYTFYERHDSRYSCGGFNTLPLRAYASAINQGSSAAILRQSAFNL